MAHGLSLKLRAIRPAPVRTWTPAEWAKKHKSPTENVPRRPEAYRQYWEESHHSARTLLLRLRKGARQPLVPVKKKKVSRPTRKTA